jgi:serine/threonine-protein kinase
METFGSYTIHEELGAGGMASVHRAEWVGPDGERRRVALKRLFPHVAENEEMVASFIDEARLARYLKHPNIAQVYEFGRFSGAYFIAFEYVPGPTVQQLERKCAAHVGPIPIAVTLNIIGQLCDALDHAHNRSDEEGLPLGIVHRDISPHNLIVSNTGLVKLIDFGLAKAKYSSVDTQMGIIKGKVNYVAPEYLAGMLDIRCDLWAVGVVMYELLVGHKLFEAQDNAQTIDRVKSMLIAPPSRFNPEIAPELDAIVLKTLERDPAKRYQNAAELRAALSGYLGTRVAITRQQLVAWVEWAFAQKAKQRADSGVSALTDIQSSPVIEVAENEDAASVATKLPAISAAMEERRRESVALMPTLPAAVLDRRWLWLIAALVVVLAIAVFALR